MSSPETPYRTIGERGTAEFEIRGSRFIGHAAPARTVETAEQFITTIRQEYADASHNVPAYRVWAEPLREWASDDGEPTGSAGKPALNVLQQRELKNVVVVVTRYFGGTELGVGGLARAYSRGVKDAINNAGVTEREPHERATITVEYDDSGTVRGILESEDIEFEATYAADVTFETVVPRAAAADLYDRVRSATSGRARID